jgi:alpha-beta hydrolase superfamily lysophospholipase
VTTATGEARPRRTFIGRLFAGLSGLTRTLLVSALVVLVALVLLRAYGSTKGAPLRPWHTIVPAELDADAVARSSWKGYVEAEARMFAQLRADLQAKMQPGDLTLLNRYNEHGYTAPAAYGQDWNRSFVLEPTQAASGVVVLLHGLTDSPYSVRGLAELYRQHGFIAIAPRMPGHGTVPAGLTREGHEEWEAATEMAMTEAARRAGGRLPIHLVGYSNGGALAVLHVLRRVGRGEPADVRRIVLLSPMIEISDGARYAGLAGLPAYFGRFAKAAWLDLLPEYNAFKYNSFPVRAARESYLVTEDLRAAVAAVASAGRLDQVPPILAFQSVVDDTVAARAVMTGLFDQLHDNGSELVYFDVNRKRGLDPMLVPEKTQWPRQLLSTPRRYTLTLVGPASDLDARAVARSRPAGDGATQVVALGLDYPRDVYSLSHIALPFTADDPLYGDRPSGRKVLQLGSVALRGERNTLEVSQDSLNRLSYNPFYAYMTQRIEATMP